MNSLTVPGGESSAYRLFADNLPARADKVGLIDQGAEITYRSEERRVGKG